jgi:hypothetical protein
MSDQESLYREIKPDIEALASPLFDFSKLCIQKRGEFLPHAAVLTAEGKVELVGAAGERDLTNSVELLPLLHGGLREMGREKALIAVGIAESVTITLPGKNPTKAIKVLFEHSRGLSVALYLPYGKKFLKGYQWGDIFSKLAPPEVKAW